MRRQPSPKERDKTKLIMGEKNDIAQHQRREKHEDLKEHTVHIEKYSLKVESFP